MQELDDLDTGTNEDLYFHRIGEQMTDLAEIFTELVDDTMIVASNGIVRDRREWKFSICAIPACLRCLSSIFRLDQLPLRLKWMVRSSAR